jgi:hypothetical protein
MSNVILGIDIGASRAVALLTGAGDLMDVFDMPVLADGPRSRRPARGCQHGGGFGGGNPVFWH